MPRRWRVRFQSASATSILAGWPEPLLPGAMSTRPSAMTPAALLLDINRWLAKSGVTIR